jgi:hypothetical protein
MKFDPFQIAAARAKELCDPDQWDALSMAEKSEAIYRELRRLDAAAVTGRSPAPATSRIVSRNRHMHDVGADQ